LIIPGSITWGYKKATMTLYGEFDEQFSLVDTLDSPPC
jgi:hypothetical protein